jgi:tetratricopeptide (TPR) repeat protein
MPTFRSCGLLTLIVLASIAPVRGADRVRTAKGSTTGTIESISAREVVVKETSGQSETIPVNEIRGISFDGEPPKLQSARAAVGSGRFDDALAALEAIDPAAIERPAIADDVSLLRIACVGRRALAGGGNPRDAGKQVREYVKNHPDSFHYYEATELLGDLLAAVGAHKNALEEYAKLEASGWPDYRLRAGVARGRALRAQGQSAEALAAYEAVLQEIGQSTDEALVAQRLAAQLGQAECLADSGKDDQAVEQVQKLIAETPPEDVEVRARAYNTLGQCLKKADRPKEALLAYLHVDVLYFSEPKAHAEALKNLAELWNVVGQPERAAQALEVWRERYGAAPPAASP